jgi:nitrogen regulatory protein PII-like uncharacterized protein
MPAISIAGFFFYKYKKLQPKANAKQWLDFVE